MNIGVSTVPCGNRIVAARARPHCARTSWTRGPLALALALALLLLPPLALMIAIGNREWEAMVMMMMMMTTTLGFDVDHLASVVALNKRLWAFMYGDDALPRPRRIETSIWVVVFFKKINTYILNGRERKRTTSNDTIVVVNNGLNSARADVQYGEIRTLCH